MIRDETLGKYWQVTRAAAIGRAKVYKMGLSSFAIWGGSKLFFYSCIVINSKATFLIVCTIFQFSGYVQHCKAWRIFLYVHDRLVCFWPAILFITFNSKTRRWSWGVLNPPPMFPPLRRCELGPSRPKVTLLIFALKLMNNYNEVQFLDANDCELLFTVIRNFRMRKGWQEFLINFVFFWV